MSRQHQDLPFGAAMDPVARAWARQRESYTSDEITDALAQAYSLTPEQLSRKLPSGKLAFDNYVDWLLATWSRLGVHMREAGKRSSYRLLVTDGPLPPPSPRAPGKPRTPRAKPILPSLAMVPDPLPSAGNEDEVMCVPVTGDGPVDTPDMVPPEPMARVFSPSVPTAIPALDVSPPVQDGPGDGARSPVAPSPSHAHGVSQQPGAGVPVQAAPVARASVPAPVPVLVGREPPRRRVGSIKGLSREMVTILNDVGITTLADLSELSPDELEQIVGQMRRGKASEIIAEARAHWSE